ncbi:unnamed protein product [Orchesella dallaii]|uniref:Uncharacterized protein n=1 Tax=Orchesella dallaii TaxID=48710 RepID=A0ABP1QLL7_9HEXA
MCITLAPAATEPVTETVDEVVNDDDITIPSTSTSLQRHIEENADTQIQNVTNEPESEPEPLNDQMAYEKLDDENESIIPYSSPLQDESSLPPTLHDIGIALVHDVVTEAQKFADSIKEIAEIPVAIEDDKTVTSAATAAETIQNVPEIPLSVVEELKTTPPLPSADGDGEVKPESSKRHELSKEVSVCSSADTVIAESVTGSEADVDENAIESVVSSLSMAGENVVVAIPKESNVAEEISKSEEPELVAEAEPEPIVEEPVITTTKIVEQAAPPTPRSSEPEIGPLSPLAPEQTPDIEAEPSHFFDRTIVIADYEPEAARARKQSLQLAQEAAAQEAPLPSAPTEPVSEPEAITIVKQDSVPPQVLSLAEKIAARILDAAKSDLAYVAAIAQGESMIALDDHKDTAAITIDEPTPESEPTITSQPRLSLDTNLPLPTTNQLETAAATATDADNADNSELFLSSDNLDTTKISSTPKAPATTPEIQVETPHADQTEMNRIAEFLEGLNTEPKEAEKLAAIPQEQPEIGQNAPIVTLADESKDSFSDSPKASQTIKTKSKLEITPIDDSQVGASSSSTIADICYVTQPLDDSQKGVDKSKILKSAVEIVSFDEGLVVASEHMEKVRKSSEPMNIGLIDPKSTETLEEAVKKLRHVMPKEQPDSGEGTGSESDKLKKTKRKSSTAQSEDSTKESEIDKYVERMANLQGSRKAMIEQAMFKSSTSSQSQGSEPEQQAADQSSNFHGPGLLDSGQSRDLPEEKIDKMKEVEKWATANINDDSKNDDDNDGKTPDVLVDIINDASLPKLEKVDVDDIDINIQVPSHEPDEEPGTESIPLENETAVVVPQEIIDKVNIFIDQAIQDGIKEAVKMLQNIGEQKNISVIETSIPEKVELGKLDEVLEELGQSSSNIILSSVPTMEPKGEKDRSGLELEPLEKEECLVFDNNSILEESNVARVTNEPVQTDNETVSHAQTQPIISTTCDNTNLQPELLLTLDNVVTQRVDGDDGQVDTKGIASDSAEKVTSLTVVKNTDDVQIADEPESISATAVEASPIEIETTIPSESLPSDSTITTTIPPVEVEPTETVLSSPQEETEEKVGDEQQEVGNEEESEENQEEDSQEIIAELETIQEEIESLSTELDQMENAAVAASAAKEEERERLALSNQERQVQQTTEAVSPPQVEETPSAEVAPTAEKQSTEAETDAQKEVISEVKEDSEAQQTPQVTGSQILQETAQVEESTTSLLDEIEKVAETPQTGESTKQEEPATVVPPSNDTIKSEISPQTEESSEPTGPVGVEELKSQATAVVGEVPQIEEKIETVAAQKTSEVPQPGETPQVTETPKLEETPEVPDTPKPDETPQVTETPELEETPEVPDTPKPDETPQVTETPKPEETPEVPETPKSEEIPEVPEPPKPEETPEVTQTPKSEETPEVPETPKSEEIPEVPEPPKPEETPEVTQTPKSEETPEIPETPKSEETPEVPEPLKPEETPQVPEPPKPEEVPEPPKPEETPEVPETPKSEETTEVPEIPKSGETPEVPETPKSEETPEVPEPLKPEETPQVPEPPKPEEVPEPPKPEEVPEPPKPEEVPEPPKPEEVPEPPKPEETPEVPETPKSEETPEVPEIPKSGETPEVPEPQKSEEIPEVPETPKIEDVLQTAEAPKLEDVTPAPEPEGIVQALEIPKEEEVSPPSTAVQEEILQISVLPTAEDSASLQTIPKPEVTAEPTTVTPLIEEKTLAISISAIGTEQQLSLVEIPNTEELPQITEASQSAQSSQIEVASTLKENETPQNIESSIPADTEQPDVDPVKTEETINVTTSSQPLSSPALPKDDIIIPSEKQTIQSQEESQISSSPIQVTADVIQQQPDAASEPSVQTESIAQPPKEQVPQPPLSQDVPPTQQISQADTVQQEQESLSASVPDEQKPEVLSLTSIDVSQSSTILPTDSTQTNTLPSAVSLHFETLSEPPFPIPPTSTPQNQYISDTSKLADSDTITASCGVVESSSLLSSASVPGLPMALTVELLDENSPEIFPLPSTQSMSTTSPVEKVQDQDINVFVGVPLTEQASSSVDTDDAAADQRATEASSATTTADATTTTTIDVVTPSTSTDQVSSAEIVDELEVPTSPAPPPTPAAHALNEPPSFPVLSAEVSKQLEQEPESMPQVPTSEAPAVVVVVEEKEAQPQQVEVKDDDGQKANRESGQNYFISFLLNPSFV